MAPKKKDTKDTIDKLDTRRPQIVLRTLPPIVFTSSTNALAFQFTMSVSGIKPSQSAAPQLEGRPSYERTFGYNTHDDYAKPQFVQREFERVNELVDVVKTDLKDARDVLDKKIDGLETQLTAKLDAQKAYIDGKFEQQDQKNQERDTLLRLNINSALDEHFATVDERFAKVDERFAKVDERFAKVDERFSNIDKSFAKVDERFSNVEERLETIEEDIGDMKDNIKLIKQMLEHLMQGGVPPTPLPSSSSQAHFLPNPPQVVVHAPPPPTAGPSSPRRHRRSSMTRHDAESIDSRGSQGEQIASVFRSIRRKVSKGFSLLNKSKERLDQ